MLSTRKLGRFTVSSVGLGCMNLSHAYGKPLSEDAAGALLLRALDLGITHFDTAALYGFGANEQLIGKVLSPHRSRFTLASKGGAFGLASDSGTRRVIDGRPATLRANCEQSLRNLKTDVIDLYYLHRWDKKVPIEESVGELGKLVKEGKIGQIGLSEISADTLRRAHAVHPIAAVQSEYSVVTRNPEIRVLKRVRRSARASSRSLPWAGGFYPPNRCRWILLRPKTSVAPCQGSRPRTTPRTINALGGA